MKKINTLPKHIFSFFFLSLCIIQTKAGNYTWTGSTSTAWTTTTNWSPNGNPSTNDTVTIVTGSNNVYLAANTTVKVITVNSGTLDLQGYNLNVSSTSTFNAGSVNNGKLILNGAATLSFKGTLFGAKVSATGNAIILSGSTFSDSLTIVKKGTSNDVGKGNNTFGGAVTLIDSASGSLELSDSLPDTFNSTLVANGRSSGVIYLAYRGTGNQFNGDVTFNGANVYSNYYGTATYSGNLTINTPSGNVYFGASTGSCTLVAGKTLSIGGSGFSSGNLYFHNFTQNDTATSISLTLTGSARVYFESGSTFKAPLTVSSIYVYLEGTRFLNTASITSNGTANYNSAGGCYFAKAVTFIQNPSVSTTYGMAVSSTDTFASKATLQLNAGIFSFNNGLFLDSVILKNNNTSTGSDRYNFGGAGNCVVKGVLKLDNNTSGMVLGSSGTVLLDSTGSLYIPSTFTGNLKIANFTQRGSTAVGITMNNSTAKLILNSGNTFSSNFTYYGNYITLNGSTFNGTTSITRYGTSGETSSGGNVFNGTTTIMDSSSHSNNYILANTTADDYNGNVTFIQKGTSVFIYPAYSANSSFAGNISAAGSSAISFGQSNGKVIMDGTSNQTISNSGFTPTLKRIEINKNSGVFNFSFPYTLGDSLILKKGIVASDTSNLITVPSGGIVAGGSDSAYVIGPLKKIGSSVFTFPLGDTVNHTYPYHSIQMTAPSSSTDAFTATFYNHNYGDTLTSDSTVENVSQCEYWKLQRNTGSSNVRVTLGWNHDTCATYSPSDMRVVGKDSTAWKNMGDTTYSGNSSVGTVTASVANSSRSIYTIANRACLSFIDTASITNVTCKGSHTGSIVLTTEGGTPPYSYSWNKDKGTTNIAFALGAEQYICTTKDAHGCVLTDSLTLSQPDSLYFTLVTTQSKCGDSSATAIVRPTGGNGSYQYRWLPYGNQDSLGSSLDTMAIHLVSGDYTVYVFDSSGCMSYQEFIISDSVATKLTIDTITGASCSHFSDGYFKGHALGSSIFCNDSTGTDSIALALGAGNYVVEITDSKGCISDTTITIPEPDPLILTLSVTSTFCKLSTGTASVVVTGGTSPYYYLWSNGSTGSSTDKLPYGPDTIEIRDAKGCRASGVVMVTDSDAPVITLDLIQGVTCFDGNDGSAHVDVSGSPSVLWLPDSSTSVTPTNFTAGYKSVKVTDSDGCIAEGLIMIPGPPRIQIDAIVVDPATDSSRDGTITPIVTGGSPPYSYSWFDSVYSANRTALDTGNYTVTITDSKSCTASATFRLPTWGTANTCDWSGLSVTCALAPAPCTDPYCTVDMVADFHADNTGTTNSECAFETAANFINDRHGNVTLTIPAGNYIVGNQNTAPSYYLLGNDVICLHDCRNVVIQGVYNVANPDISIIKFMDCMLYGTFDPTTGEREFSTHNNNTTYDHVATMGDFIKLTNCNNVEINNLHVDGNSDNMSVGGPFEFNNPMQVNADGIQINSCHNVQLNNLLLEKFGRDGVAIYAPSSVSNYFSPANISLTNVKCKYNARCGLDWGGGQQIHAYNCEFDYCGEGRFHSNVTAGMDIENKDDNVTAAHGTFTKCRFRYNYSYGIICDNGAAPHTSDPNTPYDIQFYTCQFISAEAETPLGRFSYAGLLDGKGMQFHGCDFIGTIIRGYDDFDCPTCTNQDNLVFDYDASNRRNFGCLFYEEFNNHSFNSDADDECPGGTFTGDHYWAVDFERSGSLFVGASRAQFVTGKFVTNKQLRLLDISGDDPAVTVNGQTILGPNAVDMFGCSFWNTGITHSGDVGTILRTRFHVDQHGWTNDLHYNNETIYVTDCENIVDYHTPIWDRPNSPCISKYTDPTYPNRVTDLWGFYSGGTTVDEEPFCPADSCPTCDERQRKHILSKPLSVTPNPTRTFITVGNENVGQEMSIYNAFGVLVWRSIIESVQENISVEGFSSGLYIISVANSNPIKFIKE